MSKHRPPQSPRIRVRRVAYPTGDAGPNVFQSYAPVSVVTRHGLQSSAEPVAIDRPNTPMAPPDPVPHEVAPLGNGKNFPFPGMQTQSNLPQ